jgi:hypothetical protein
MDNPIQAAPPQVTMAPRMPVSMAPALSGLMQPQLLSLYANGFEISATGADLIVTFVHNGKSFATLNLSFTTAKALGSGLSQLVADLEDRSKTKVLSAEEVVKALENK